MYHNPEKPGKLFKTKVEAVNTEVKKPKEKAKVTVVKKVD